MKTAHPINTRILAQRACRQRFPHLDPFGHRLAVSPEPREKMHMVGHQQIIADEPTVVRPRTGPAIQENFVGGLAVEQSAAPIGRHRKEDYRRIGFGFEMRQMPVELRVDICHSLNGWHSQSPLQRLCRGGGTPAPERGERTPILLLLSLSLAHAHVSCCRQPAFSSTHRVQSELRASEPGRKAGRRWGTARRLW